MEHQDSATSSTSSVGGSGVWRRVSRPSVLVAVGSPIVLLIDIGLIVVFLLRENWQGVIYSSVAFLAWTQVIYWFFRTRTLVTARRQLRSGAGDAEAAADTPPPYEEVIKTEAPPPPYYMVVPEGGWSSGAPSCSSYTGKGSSSPKKGGHLEVSGSEECGGITAPYIHHITSDETTGSTTTPVPPPAYVDPVQVIRAPIVTSLPAPTHKPTARESSRRPDAGV